MKEIRLNTLGGLTLVRGGLKVPKLERQPVRSALLVYLAMEREARRDELVHLLWPERDERDGRRNLNQNFYGLKQLLGEEWAEREGDVVTVTDAVRVDVQEFEEAVATGVWNRALEAYQGPFLDSTSLVGSRPFQEWCERHRARLSRLAREAWRGAFDSPSLIADVEVAIRLAAAWVRHDPLDDEAQHTLLEQLARAGRRADVIEAYERYETLIHEELEVEPLDHTKALVDLVRSGELRDGGWTGRSVARASEERPVRPGAPGERRGEELPPVAPPHLLAPPRARRLWLLGAIPMAVAGLLAVALRAGDPAPSAAGPLAFDLTPPLGVTPIQGVSDAVVSPDGSTVLFVGTDTAGSGLWSRATTTPATHRLPGTDGAHTPFWAPSGSRFGYFARKHLWIATLEGGAGERLAEVTFESRGASWGPDDWIVFAPDPRSGIHAVSVADGTVRRVTEPDRGRGEVGHLWPDFVPGTSTFVFFVPSSVDSVQGIYAASLDDPSPRFLTRASGSAAVAGRHLLFYRDGDLLAQPFDTRALALSGRAERVVAAVAGSWTYQAGFSASERNGILVYSSDSTKTRSRMEVLSADGLHQGYRTPLRHQRNPDLSPDGRALAVELYSGTRSEVAAVDLETGGVRRSGDPAQGLTPVWGPEGRRIAYVAGVPEGWALRVWDLDSTRGPATVRVFPHEIVLTDWSAELGVLLYRRAEEGIAEALRLRVDGPSSPGPELLLRGDAHYFDARASADGRRLAYVSDGGGAFQVFVEPFPADGRRCQLSATGGVEPRWGPADSTLYFLDLEGNLARVSVPRDGRCEPPRPERVARRVTDRVLVAASNYDVDPARGLVVLNRYEIPVAHTISVLVDWPLALAGRGGDGG